MRPRSSDHEFQAAQVPTLGQPRKPTWERGTRRAIPTSSAGWSPKLEQWTCRPGVSLPTQPGIRMEQCWCRVEVVMKRREKKKLHWVEMWGVDGVGQLLKSPAFRPALARCIGLRRYHPPPHRKIKLMM